MITAAFTCTGPYAVLIMLGIKRVENRSAMPAPARGRCAVTCSKSFDAAEYGNFFQWASRALPPEEFARVPAWADVCDWPGEVVGCCDYEARARTEKFDKNGQTCFIKFSDGPGEVVGCCDYEARARTEKFDKNGQTCFIKFSDGRDGEAGDRAMPWDEGYPYWWQLSEVACFDRPIPCRGNVGMWPMPPALAAQVNAADVLARCVGERVEDAEDARRIFRAAVPLAGTNEGLFVLPLDDGGRVLAEPVLASLGDHVTTVVRPGDVFGVAFRHEAASVIIAHNHPSGDPTPSVQDRQLTAALRAFGDSLGVRVLDHLIITSNENRS